MRWTSGPFDDHAILWLGLKVFWWRRIFMAAQLLTGLSVLANLLTRPQKLRFAQWFQTRRQRAIQIQIPRFIRFRKLLKRTLILIIILAIPIAAAHQMKSHNGSPLPFIPAFFAAAIILALLSLPIIQLLIFFSALRIGLRAGQRFLPPAFAWLFDHRRLDRTLTWMNFFLFVAVWAGQMYLS